jgi:hypothetical protein
VRKFRRHIIWSGVLVLLMVACVFAYLRGQHRWAEIRAHDGTIAMSLLKVTGVSSFRQIKFFYFLYCDVLIDNNTGKELNGDGAWASRGRFRLVVSRDGKIVAEAPIEYQSVTSFYRLEPGQRPVQLVACVDIPGDDTSDLEARIVVTLPEGQGQDVLESNSCPVEWPGPIEGDVGLTLIQASLNPGGGHHEATLHCEVDFDNRTGESLSTTYYSCRLDGFWLELWRGDKRVSSQNVGTLSSNHSLGTYRLTAGRSREQFVFSVDCPPGGWTGLEVRIVGYLSESRYDNALESNRLPLQLAGQ